jgi:hypothetical protein
MTVTVTVSFVEPGTDTFDTTSSSRAFPLARAPRSQPDAQSLTTVGSAVSGVAVMLSILMPDTSPSTASMCVSKVTVAPGFASALVGLMLTLRVPVVTGAEAEGDAEPDSEGDGVVVARADAPPVARMAAVPRPMNIGLTADRQITAAAPPSRRR